METSHLRARALGPCEKYSSSRHALGFYKCVINTCRYAIPADRLQDRSISEVFEEAVANVVLDIPSLSVGIKDEETSSPYFVYLPAINLQLHLGYLEIAGDFEAGLIQKLQDQHDQYFSDIAHRPPWRVTIVSNPHQEDELLNFEVIFAVHHSIADGRSTAMFHTKLLDELSSPSKRPIQLSNHVLSISPDRELTPPLEEVVEFTQSWSFLFGTLFRELGPAWLSGSSMAVPWTGKSIAPEPFQTHLRLVTVPAAAAPSVLAACRGHGTTLTPLLHALVLASLAKIIPVKDTHAFCSSTPIDLRPFASGNPLSKHNGMIPFGVLVTTQMHHFEPDEIRGSWDEADIWRTAVSLKGRIREHLETVPKDDIISMLSWVSDWRKFWLSKVGTSRQNTWEVSNIGSIRGVSDINQSQPGWRIRRSIMSQGATVAGAAIGVNVAGVTGGDICITLSWQEGIVETNLVEKLERDLRRWLCQLGSGEKLAWE
ncbi:alcohol acetyltransferase [Triangularia verruculosa]|uniref:Alcohol acetyltransferase n=1 Tax=Triangularia verruculosa TaxID=2587418 RepID=A0AAN6XBL7_9PEZI|nr:alcohol acetyltransferase [Triangularia verruculosa]